MCTERVRSRSGNQSHGGTRGSSSTRASSAKVWAPLFWMPVCFFTRALVVFETTVACARECVRACACSCLILSNGWQVVVTPPVIKSLAAGALLFAKKLANDLESFANHAGRTQINVDDCKLFARNLPVGLHSSVGIRFQHTGTGSH